MSRYADILLPLPVAPPGRDDAARGFTYALPARASGATVVGARVLVPFGPQHFYTGLVLALHDTPPVGYAVREVAEVLDRAPIVRAAQVELWHWMADYYLCSVGEVMRAALPAGLKLESETVVTANRDYEATAADPLTPTEREVLAALGDHPVRIAALEKLTKRRGLLPVVRRLIDREAAFIHETTAHDYQPRVCERVRPVLEGRDEATLAAAFATLDRAPKQQALFMKLLDMSRYFQSATPTAVDKQSLLRSAGCSPAILQELKKKGLAATLAATPDDTPAAAPEALEPPHTLSAAQAAAFDAIHQAFGRHAVTLLHGVTSSGKTELYIHLVGETMAAGRQALLLVPEIALTTQLCARLRRVFGSTMVVYHSRLSDGERVALWRKMLSDAADGDTPRVGLIVGVRSAVFLPFQRLGLVIVDEEHEPSFKQQDPAPRYHGRDVAIILARRHGAKVLLGSATPSLESYYQAQRGKYGLVTLTERHAGTRLPRITFASLVEARREHTMTGPFTPLLLSRIGDTLRDGQQVILFQNRRGFAPVVECAACGWVPRCPRCDVALTYHKHTARLLCHYCGLTQPLPTRCPACGGRAVGQVGYGTERIEEQIASAIPLARTLRMDADTTAARKDYERIIRQFEERRGNLLVGTQMVAKGLDFAGVRTVGILNADIMMARPDFRAHERAFQLMEQVAGRAGRRDTAGEVIIQCSDPHHPLLRQVAAHDYHAMAETQLADRARYHYPPYTRMVAVYMKGRYADRLRAAATAYATLLRRSFGDRVLGPEAPAVARVKNLHILVVLLKIEREASPAEVRRIFRFVQEEMSRQKDFSRLIFYYDVDPA